MSDEPKVVHHEVREVAEFGSVVCSECMTPARYHRSPQDTIAAGICWCGAVHVIRPTVGAEMEEEA